MLTEKNKKFSEKAKIYGPRYNFITHRFCFILIAFGFTDSIVLCRASLINSNHLSYTRYLIVKV